MRMCANRARRAPTQNTHIDKRGYNWMNYPVIKYRTQHVPL